MTAPPDISVVMSVYNNAATLPAALESILSQEGVALEFIVVNDGSTDGTAAILDEAAARDPRLKVVHKKNEGLTRALIDGCAQARAPWIARQDADDVSLPGRLKAQLARAQQPDGPAMVVCAAMCQTPEGLPLYTVALPPDEAAARKQILEQGKTLCPHGAILMSTAAYQQVGGYRPQFYFAQDLDLVTRLAERGGIGIVSETRYAFLFTVDSISGRHHKQQETYCHLIGKSHQARQRGDSETPWLNKAAALSSRIRARGTRPSDKFAGLYFIGCCLRRREPALAREYLARALDIRPWSPRAWLRWLEAVGRLACTAPRKLTGPTATKPAESISFPAQLARPADYIRFSIGRRVHRMATTWENRLSRCDVRVVGAYFSGNLGDWTMGQMALRAGRMLSRRPGLFDYTYMGNPRLPLVMGGGELGNAFHFERALRRAPAPAAIAACGINPVHDFDRLPATLLERISRFVYLSARSLAGAEAMREVLARQDIEYRPDLAFGLWDFIQNREAARPVRSRPVLAVNAMTFYLSVQEQKYFAPDRTLISIVADPRFSALVETAGQQYATCMRQLVHAACAQGWEVVNIPFSQVDAMFAEVLWAGLPVRRPAYSRDPHRILGLLQTCDKFVATRFHAHVFGFLAQVPTVSIAYSGKCQYLWKELGLNPAQQISRLDLCADPYGCAERIQADFGVVLPASVLARLSQESRAGAEKAFRLLATIDQKD